MVNNYNMEQSCLWSLEAMSVAQLIIANAATSDTNFDAVAKYGASVDIGNYDGCSVQYGLHYCLVGSIPRNDVSSHYPLPPFSGICLPQNCTSSGLNNQASMNWLAFQLQRSLSLNNMTQFLYFNKLFNNLIVASSTYTGFTCGNHAAYMTLDRYIIYIILIALIILVIVSTLYDIIRPATDAFNDSNGQFGWRNIFQCFSLTRNISKVFELSHTASSSSKQSKSAVTSTSNTFRIFDGIRTLSILWIILGHTLAISSSIGLVNPQAVLPPTGFIKNLSSQIFFSARYGVDCFLYISGFLVVLTMLHKLTPSSTTVDNSFSSSYSFSNLDKEISEDNGGQINSSPLKKELKVRRYYDSGDKSTEDLKADMENDVFTSESSSLLSNSPIRIQHTQSALSRHNSSPQYSFNTSRKAHDVSMNSNYSWIPMMYFMRYLRIIPSYLFCLLFWWKIAVMMGQGPFWHRWLAFTGICDNYFWTNLLFINNLYPYGTTESNECFYVSWYLAVDFQYYLVSPLFIIAYLKSPLLGIVSVCSICLLSTLLIAYLTYQYGYSSNTFDGLWVTGYSIAIYTKPHTRIQPYCIGMVTAMIWHYKSTYYPHSKLPQYAANALQYLACIAVLAYVYGSISAYQRRPCGYNEPSSELCGSDWSLGARVIMNSTSKLGWASALAVITLLCANDQAESIRRFLSHSVFFVASKLTFAVYLIHVIILNIWVYSRTQKYRYSHFDFAMDYLGVVSVSYLFALIVTVLIESPAAALTKTLEKRFTYR